MVIEALRQCMKALQLEPLFEAPELVKTAKSFFNEYSGHLMHQAFLTVPRTNESVYGPSSQTKSWSLCAETDQYKPQ